MRSAVLASLILSLTAAFAADADDGFTLTPVPAAVHTLKVGKLEVTVLHDAQIVVPNDGKSFGVGAPPGEVAALLAAAGAPTSDITLSVNVLMVKTEGHIVLLDAGTGPEWHGALLDSLKLTGIAPSAITDVLITHSHGDHINGLLDPKGRLAFVNATVRMSDEEWEWLKTKGSEHLVTTISGHVTSFRPGAVIAPGIRSVALDGHTPGHVGYDISSNGARLRDIGDVAHSVIISLARPQWRNGFDRDEDEALEVRTTLLGQLAAAHDLVFVPHFPFPGIGHIVNDAGTLKWQPLTP